MLKLPSLRERQGDLGLLIESMIQQVNRELSTGAKNLMLQHSWPGNARELFNTIMRICVWYSERTIQEEDVRQALLPSHAQSRDDILQKSLGDGFKLQEILDVISSQYIRQALEKTGGSKSKAAQLLGIKNYQTLSNWIKKYGVKP